jgi:hypothetical protein
LVCIDCGSAAITLRKRQVLASHNGHSPSAQAGATIIGAEQHSSTSAVFESLKVLYCHKSGAGWY